MRGAEWVRMKLQRTCVEAVKLGNEVKLLRKNVLLKRAGLLAGASPTGCLNFNVGLLSRSSFHVTAVDKIFSE